VVVFDELRAKYADDETIMSIVRAGEEICNYDEIGTTTEPAMTETPTVEPMP
jgi:hypothetical protein